MEKIKPSDLHKKAQDMVDDGSMPSVEEFLDALQATRDKYSHKILEAQSPSDVKAGAEALAK